MILVIGGTGQVGRRVVELLRAGGHQVRILTRDPSRAARPAPDGIEYVTGDLLDGDSVRNALDGVSAVVCTAHGGHGARAAGPRGVEGRGLPQLIRLASQLPLRQFVYTSAASARPDSPADLFRAKAAVEAALLASGVPCSVIRPTHLLETWVPLLAEPLVRKSRAMIIGNGHNPVSWVAAHDVAQAAAVLATEDGGGTVTLGGPQALTLRELNARVERALKVSTAKTTTMSPGMLGIASRIVRPFNEVMGRQMRLGLLLDTQPQVVDAEAVWQRLGIEPTTVDGWLDANLPAVAAAYGPQPTSTGERAPGNAAN